MSADPTVNGELEYPPVPASGPVRAVERRGRMLPALPLSPTTLATGGILAGMAALLALRRARGRQALATGRGRRAGRSRSVVASRSFLVDVHVLGR